LAFVPVQLTTDGVLMDSNDGLADQTAPISPTRAPCEFDDSLSSPAKFDQVYQVKVF